MIIIISFIWTVNSKVNVMTIADIGQFTARKGSPCRGLQIQLTPMLAGLMELDPQYAWSFDQFFSAMQQVSSSAKVHVYNVTQMELLWVYLPPGARSVLRCDGC